MILYYELLTGARSEPYAKEYIEEFPKQYDIIKKDWRVPPEARTYHLDMLDPTKINHPIIA